MLRIVLALDPQLRHELDLLVLVLVLLGVLLLDRVLVVRLVRDLAERLFGKLRDQVAKGVLPMRVFFIGSLGDLDLGVAVRLRSTLRRSTASPSASCNRWLGGGLLCWCRSRRSQELDLRTSHRAGAGRGQGRDDASLLV